MSDVARFLPLSQQPREDESGVSSNWSPQLSVVLADLARVVDSLSPEELDAPSLQPGYRVRDSLGHLFWRLGSTRRARGVAITKRVLSQRESPASARRSLSVEAAHTATAPATALRTLAAAASVPSAHSTIGDLSVVVVDALDVARSTGRPLAINGVATGAVALARSLSAPTPIRAVVRQRTLSATDADWTVGTGKELRGTAAAIVLFLWRRADIPQEGAAGR